MKVEAGRDELRHGYSTSQVLLLSDILSPMLSAREFCRLPLRISQSVLMSFLKAPHLISLPPAVRPCHGAGVRPGGELNADTTTRRTISITF